MVLDGGNLVRGNPVNITNGSTIFNSFNGLGVVVEGEVSGGEFFRGLIEELSDTVGTSLISLDDFEVSSEDLQSVSFKFRFSIFLTVDSLELSPLSVDFFSDDDVI